MADLDDVTVKLAEIAGAAVYPNGVEQPSVSGENVRIYPGWPMPDRLDQDIRGEIRDAAGQVKPSPHGRVSHVSVFPVNGSISATVQVFEDPYVVVPAVHTVSALVTGQSVTLSGAPTPDQYVSIIADGRHCYSRVGASLAEICQLLASDAQAHYPGASFTGLSVTIPGASLVVRIGAKATMGKLLHRQKQTVQVTVWAPTPEMRGKLASTIDVVMKQNLRITFPDTSQAIMIFDRTNQVDDHQNEGIYRRDLLYTVEYGTVELFPAYEVTSFTVQSSADDGVPVTTVS